MKKEVVIGILLIVLLINLVSAFSFSDFFDKITGQVIRRSEPRCSDSDGGLDFNVKGTVTYKSWFRERTYEDKCRWGKVIEYYCENDRKRYTRYNCAAGCEEGVCEPEQFEQGPYNPGLRVLEFNYEDGEKIRTAIWYPTEEEPKDFSYMMMFKSKVAFNSEIAPAPEVGYPMIIYAHGFYSSGYDNAIQAEYLASNGYIVVAPDYHDVDFLTGDPVGMPFNRIPQQHVYGYEEETGSRWGGRFRQMMSRESMQMMINTMRSWQTMFDINESEYDENLFYNSLEESRLGPTRFVIDTMLEDDYFSQYIDEGKIGMFGHSMGCLTSLGLIGTWDDESLYDERIKAVVLLAPAGIDNSSNIKIPTMTIIGEKDMIMTGVFPGISSEDVPSEEMLSPLITYYEAKGSKYFIVLNAFMPELPEQLSMDHYMLTDAVAMGTPLYIAREKEPWARLVSEHLLAFFKKNIDGVEPNPIEQIDLEKYNDTISKYRKNEAPVWSLLGGAVASGNSLDITATDPEGSKIEYEFASSPTLQGASINEEAGRVYFEWNPSLNTAGDYEVTIIASDEPVEGIGYLEEDSLADISGSEIRKTITITIP